VSVHDGVFEPLRGKRRAVRQALLEAAERWTANPIADPSLRRELEAAVAHLLRRGQIQKELPEAADPAMLAETFVSALVHGKGAAAVDFVLGPEPDRAPKR
jgi:hypothetical protein